MLTVVTAAAAIVLYYYMGSVDPGNNLTAPVVKGIASYQESRLAVVLATFLVGTLAPPARYRHMELEYSTPHHAGNVQRLRPTTRTTPCYSQPRPLSGPYLGPNIPKDSWHYPYCTEERCKFIDFVDVNHMPLGKCARNFANEYNGDKDSPCRVDTYMDQGVEMVYYRCEDKLARSVNGGLNFTVHVERRRFDRKTFRLQQIQ